MNKYVMNAMSNQELLREKVLMGNALITCIKEMHVVREWEYLGIPIVKEVSPSVL